MLYRTNLFFTVMFIMNLNHWKFKVYNHIEALRSNAFCVQWFNLVNSVQNREPFHTFVISETQLVKCSISLYPSAMSRERWLKPSSLAYVLSAKENLFSPGPSAQVLMRLSGPPGTAASRGSRACWRWRCHGTNCGQEARPKATTHSPGESTASPPSRVQLYPECLALRYCTFTPAVKVKAPLPSVTLLQDRGHSETSLY